MIQSVTPTLTLLAQRLRNELNELRRDPRSFIDYLRNKLRFYRENLYFLEDRPESAIRTSQGDKAPLELIEQLSKLQPLRPIEHSQVLQQAAEKHARDLGQTGKYDHKGSDGTDFEDRVAKYGKWRGHLVEVLECGYRQPKDILASLLIDDGMPTRPHRKTLLNADVHFEGISIHTHTVFEYVTVMVFSSEIPTTEQRLPERVTQIFPSRAIQHPTNGQEQSPWRSAPLASGTDIVMELPSTTAGKGHCECRLF